LNWLVHEGDKVRKGQAIFEAESDKSTLEVEAPEDGIIGKLLAKPGNVIPSGETVALLIQSGEDYIYPDAESTPSIPSQSTSNSILRLPRDQIARNPDRVAASPLARRLARINAINLDEIHGTGPRGRIIRADVLDAIDVRARDGITPIRGIPNLSGVRGTIARRMLKSAHDTAPVTLTTEVDASKLVHLRNVLQTEYSEIQNDISYDLLIAIIASKALASHPELNASLSDNGIVRHEGIHIGVAIDTERGLLVPVLKNVNNRELIDLAKDLADKVERAREGTLTKEEMTGSTFTITNLGLFGVDAFTPIINLPECAVLGIGRIREMPIALDGVLEIGTSLTLSLTFDHRIVDGGPAARFLQAVSQKIQELKFLWID